MILTFMISIIHFPVITRLDLNYYLKTRILFPGIKTGSLLPRVEYSYFNPWVYKINVTLRS